MKINSIPFCILALLCTACNYLKFEQAQPSGAPALKSFPENWNGSYFDKENDTVIIDGSIFGFYAEDSKFNYRDTLPSKRSVLKKLNNDFILNIRDEKIGFYDVFLIKPMEDGFQLLTINLENNKDSLLQVIKSICKVQTKQDSDSKDTYYLVNPNTVAFKKIIDSNLFSDPVAYYKRK